MTTVMEGPTTGNATSSEPNPETRHSTTEESVSSYFVETALEWFERCEALRQAQRQIPDKPPTTPASAAWAFFRGASIHGGTGNPFIDEALRRRGSPRQLPALEIRDRKSTAAGDYCGKTHTLVSLAAQFVVATRPSLFSHHDDNSTNSSTLQICRPSNTIAMEKQKLPRVIILDSGFDMSTVRLAHAVSSQLMLHPTMMLPNDNEGDDDDNDDNMPPNNPRGVSSVEIERDMEDCLSRIHIAHVDDMREWVPVLEALRHELQHQPNNNHTEDNLPDAGDVENGEDPTMEQDFPTLLLWDGFLSEPGRTPGLQKEILRQLALLLGECTIGFVCSNTAAGSSASRANSTFQIRDLLVEGNNPGLSNNNRNGGSGNAGAGGQRQAHHLPTGMGPSLFAKTIVLERDERPDSSHDFLATVVQGNHQIPYTLSSSGVLP